MFDINFNFKLVVFQTDGTANMSVKNLLNERGHQLEEVYLAGNKSVGTPSLLFIQVCCERKAIVIQDNIKTALL